MQNGSMMRTERQSGLAVWEYRWREPGADGKRRHRRIVVGSVDQFADKSEALQAIAALRRDINLSSTRSKFRAITVSDLINHYRQREITSDRSWKSHATKATYEGYFNKWILPRWGGYTLARTRAGEVEQWLHSLPLARGSCAKIRNIMSMLFNHGIRHDICDRNPIRWVRQSAKRRNIPVVLDADEIRLLLDSLRLRERTMVLLAAGTGLRMSELFGIKWLDVNFKANEISVTRSIVMGIVGPCKTEASQKAVPLDPKLAEALQTWRQDNRYDQLNDWVFASVVSHGRQPYWGQSLMRNVIRPAARAVGNNQAHRLAHISSQLLDATTS